MCKHLLVLCFKFMTFIVAELAHKIQTVGLGRVIFGWVESPGISTVYIQKKTSLALLTRNKNTLREKMFSNKSFKAKRFNLRIFLSQSWFASVTRNVSYHG